MKCMKHELKEVFNIQHVAVKLLSTYWTAE